MRRKAKGIRCSRCNTPCNKFYRVDISTCSGRTRGYVCSLDCGEVLLQQLWEEAAAFTLSLTTEDNSYNRTLELF